MFTLSKKEEIDYLAFRKKHWKVCKQGTIPVMFNPTGIGNVVALLCPTCGITKDITDVDSW
jgi:hypothetical protein